MSSHLVAQGVALPSPRRTPLPALPKAATGISGLDEVTGGGLPLGRPTLVCGPAGCGKTLLAMEFLVRGITEFGEPGVFIAFEETANELVANVASMGFDLQQLQDDGLLVVDHVPLAPSDLLLAGAWDLEGLFIRIGAAIDAVGEASGPRHNRDPVRSHSTTPTCYGPSCVGCWPG